MHGGVKVYRGTAAAARNYLDADRSRADDYYLAEGTGIARRFMTGPDGPVVELASLTGNGYEAWVAGLDPESGEPRGRLRADASAVRFVEVVVNGPKSWSLAAELHPDLAAAYQAAQDSAAGQIIGWLGQHATTRVGPRGAQVAVPVDALEAVTVRHYTSRAGDPHRHLHLQVNARVFAAGKWRGLDTVAVRDSIQAVNGIGHAAVLCDPEFRAALAAHGYTLNEAGEIEQLARFVGPFSKRAAQICGLLDRYEAHWRTEHPRAEPGPRLRRGWDARAWAENRPDKVIPRSGDQLRHRWLAELAELGYRDRDKPIQLALYLPGALDRDAAVAEIVTRLGAARSAWNAADVRGQVEQLLARHGIVAEQAVRRELAEDLTARALAQCLSVTEQPTPEHVRALTSQHVLDVEADLVARLAVRGAAAATPAGLAHLDKLDTGQRSAVGALAGDALLVVIMGAAGAGKTTTLAATGNALAEQHRRLVVVTPTLKAARGASAEVGARAGSAAWLVFQHGWRWDATGAWTRTPRQPASEAALRRGDLLLIDEAAMLDQDTARALLTVADETGARVAFIGDRRQLPAVGRGGVLDLAHRWVAPSATVSLDEVHRFTRVATGVDGKTVWVPDPVYAVLSLQMRQGENPTGVFDALQARGQIAVHASEYERQQSIADQVVAEHRTGRTVAVVVDTREQAAVLNSAIRDRLIAGGLVDDRHTTGTHAGESIGAGDLIATRRNNPDLGVANRDTWTVTRVRRDGVLTVSGDRGRRELPAEYVREHVELGYASTAHGAQGDTATAAHLAIGDYTTAASAYVGMTRGRERNTAHVVAADFDDAREQWISAFSRDRADLGPAHAAARAAREAAGYTPARPLHEVLSELREAWRQQADQQHELQSATAVRARLEQVVALRAQRDQAVAVLDPRHQQAEAVAEQARAKADRCAGAIDRHAHQVRDRLVREWERQREQAREAARVVLAGPGRLGLRLGRVNRATETLARWSITWQPYLPDMPTSTTAIARYASWPHDGNRVAEAFDEYARAQAEHTHPEHDALQQAAKDAEQRRRQVWREASDLHSHLDARLLRYGALAYADDPDQRLAQAQRLVSDSEARLAATGRRIDRLTREPALASQAPGWLERQRDRWHADDAAETTALQRITELRHALAIDAAARERMHTHEGERDPFQHDMGRHGPRLGR